MPRISKNNVFITILCAWNFFSCSITKFVDKDEYLLNKVYVNIDNKTLSKSEATQYLSEKPNTKLLGLGRYNLRLYALSGRDENKKINKFFRRIGEKPVLYDPATKNRSIENLDSWLKNRGYYNALIENTTKLINKKAYVTYDITTNKPHIISRVYRSKATLPTKLVTLTQIEAQLGDFSDIRKNYIINAKNTLLEENNRLDAKTLQDERKTLTIAIRNQGYYDFSEDNIRFLIDTLSENHKADIYFDVRHNNNEQGEKIPFKKHKIRQVFVYINTQSGSKAVSDTTTLQHIRFIVEKKTKFNLNTIVRANFINPEKFFSLDDITHTYERLGRLNQFKSIRISFDKIGEDKPSDFGYLDAHIFLSLFKKQSYAVELEGTINSGNYGVFGNYIYRNRNLFRGAETFDVEVSGGYERVATSIVSNFDAKELRFSTNLSIPKFFFPLKSQNKFTRKYNPYTDFYLTYDLQRRPEYKRTISNFVLSYKWKAGSKVRHIFAPIDVGIIKVLNLDTEFFNSLNNLYFQYSFQDHIIASSRYSFIFNERKNKINRSYTYFRINIESAGNALHMLDKLLKSEEQDIISEGEIIGMGFKRFDIQYAQYIRGELDLSYYHYLNSKNLLVYHLFFGIGYPYTNSEVMPFEKLYFAGGTNSMRGWQSRSLGPGSSQLFARADNFSYADMRAEANLEYRFSLIKSLEGALFLDIGNVWTLTNLYNDEMARFRFNRFYKEVGVGTGFGLRLNLDVLVLRVDAGLKLYDPYLPEHSRFVPKAEKWNFNDLVINFGFGYPF